jgi:hypothetical protein
LIVNLSFLLTLDHAVEAPVTLNAPIADAVLSKSRREILTSLLIKDSLVFFGHESQSSLQTVMIALLY